MLSFRDKNNRFSGQIKFICSAEINRYDMITRLLNYGLKYLNLSIRPLPVYDDMEKEFLELYSRYKSFTMTSIERMYAAFKSVEYIEKEGIEGAVVECGVWKGGSSMIMASNLIKKGSVNRDFYLYDTFEGMPEPSEKDRDFRGISGRKDWEKNKRNDKNLWCYASLEEVRSNMKMTGYPENRIHYIQGKVEDTIPSVIPKKIAILRLDTDWYESSYHELKYLYPLLIEKGILILDDYGHWKGQRDAVDQYFSEEKIQLYLNRIDYTGRSAIKKP